MSNADTKERIMDAAQKIVQAKGYNGLSFRDLATEVGVKSASVHYHFPTKGDLGAALAKRYTEIGIKYFNEMSKQSLDKQTAMKKYTDIFRMALVSENRMCLCGIMSAEYADLPPEVRVEVDNFTEANVNWLAQLFSSDLGEDEASLGKHALSIFAAIEGAQLVARGKGQVAIYDQIIEAYRKAGLFP